jgi:hypothetical protein
MGAVAVDIAESRVAHIYFRFRVAEAVAAAAVVAAAHLKAVAAAAV